MANPETDLEAGLSSVQSPSSSLSVSPSSSSHPSLKHSTSALPEKEDEVDNTRRSRTSDGPTTAAPDPQQPTDDTNDVIDASHSDPTTTTTTTTSDDLNRPYSIFTKWQRHFILSVASLAAFFSPLTGQIYLPALPILADAFGVSNAKINLTLTTYMIFQGLTPMFFAGLADSFGRRPAYLLCFAIYIASNIGLALVRSYAALLVVRMLQSAGAAVTIALNQAVLADIITSAERGRYMGYSVLPTLLAPALGPLLGGVLIQRLGWRSIFWFLAISASVVFLVMLFFFPETCRNVVGDGSLVPPRVYRTLWQVIASARRHRHSRKLSAAQRRRRSAASITDGTPLDLSRTISQRSMAPKLVWVPPNVLGSFQIMAEPEMTLLYLQISLVFAGFYAIITTMPSQLTERYAFSTLHVGLMYMPLAAGSGIAILIAGRLIDRSFRRHAARAGVAIVKGRQQDLARINVERARLEVVLPMLVLSAAVMFSWGWVLQADAHWGYIIMLMFILGMCIAVANNASNTLIIECCPGRVAAGIAANNISRCLVGAAMTAAIEPLITAIGPGLAFIVIGWLYLTCVPIALVLMRWGMGWRLKSAEKQRLKKERKEAEKALAS